MWHTKKLIEKGKTTLTHTRYTNLLIETTLFSPKHYSLYLLRKLLRPPKHLLLFTLSLPQLPRFSNGDNIAPTSQIRASAALFLSIMGNLKQYKRRVVFSVETSIRNITKTSSIVLNMRYTAKWSVGYKIRETHVRLFINLFFLSIMCKVTRKMGRNAQRTFFTHLPRRSIDYPNKIEYLLIHQRFRNL